MIPLAATDLSTFIGVIILAIAGIAKLMTKAAADKIPPPGSQRRASPVQSLSEEERTRKFLEALGLPPTSLDPRKSEDTMRSTRTTVRQAPTAPLNPPTLPQQQMRGSRERMGHPAAEPARPPQSVIEARRLEKKLRQAEQRRPVSPLAPPPATAYESAIERLHLADLKTPEMPHFQTKSSDVSAIPFELPDSVAATLYVKDGTARQTELLRLARSPRALRQAILMREILGPPRSLQSDFAASNVPPL